MSRGLLFFVFLSTFAWAEPTANHITPSLKELLASVKATDFVDRLDKFSEKFLGTPFINAPLGEGPGARYDQGPLFRFDGFDCTTLIETVTALALSTQPKDFPTWLRRIRYRDGKIDYLARNHFPCGDWIPNNSAAGYLTDITETLAGPLGTEVATTQENKKEWIAHLPKDTIRVTGLKENERELRLAELQKRAANLLPQTVSLRFIPLSKLITFKPVSEEERKRREAEEPALTEKLKLGHPTEAPEKAEEEIHKEVVGIKLRYLIQDTDVDARFLNDVPSGSLINIVRPNHSVPGTHLLISHQGLVVRKKGVPYFRHTSLSGGARTKDVLLATYLRLCLLHTAIHGIQVLRINDLRRNEIGHH